MLQSYMKLNSHSKAFLASDENFVSQILKVIYLGRNHKDRKLLECQAKLQNVLCGKNMSHLGSVSYQWHKDCYSNITVGNKPHFGIF